MTRHIPCMLAASGCRLRTMITAAQRRVNADPGFSTAETEEVKR
jgi:hypothetical protein